MKFALAAFQALPLSGLSGNRTSISILYLCTTSLNRRMACE